MEWASVNPNSLLRVCIGDIITLKHGKPLEGWLSANGIIHDDVVLSKESTKFENCLWEVCVQHQYSAAEEYHIYMNEFLNKNDELIQSNRVILEQSEKAAANERKLNEKLMEMKLGKPISYGDVIQLRHVKSSKYLIVNPFVLAKQERENIQVQLDEDGGTDSWLECIPRNKYDNEGLSISNVSEVLLRVQNRPNEYIHCSHKASRALADKVERPEVEINCSLESSIWLVSIFQQANKKFTSLIGAGQIVSLQEPMRSSYLSVHSKPDESDDVVMVSNSTSLGSDELVSTNSLWIIENSEMMNGGAILNNISTFVLRHLNTCAYLKIEQGKAYTEKNRQLCSLLKINTSSSTSGEIHEDMHICMHENNLYLSSSIIQVSTTNHGEARNDSKLTVESQCKGSVDKSSAIVLVIGSKLHRKLNVELYFGIEVAAMLKTFKEICLSQKLDYLTQNEIDSLLKHLFRTLGRITNFLSLSSSQTGEEASSTSIIGKKKQYLKQIILQEQGVLSLLLDLLELCMNDTFVTIKYDRSRKSRKAASPIPRSATRMSLRKLISQVSSVEDSSTLYSPRLSGLLSAQKSMMLTRESSNVDAKTVRESIISPKNIIRKKASAHYDRKNSIGKVQIERKLSTDLKSTIDRQPSVIETSKMERTGSVDEYASPNQPSGDSGDANISPEKSLTGLICEEALKAFLVIIKGNRINQMFIADRFPVILNCVKYDELAVICVHEMLHNNLQMLQTKVREREISIFITLLEQTQFNVTVLRLLQSTCSCPMGVDSTQRLVATALFAGTRSSKSSLLQATPEEEHKRLLNDELKVAGVVDLDSQQLSLRKNLLIRVTANSSENEPIGWSFSSKFIPIDKSKMQCMNGISLLNSGLPMLYLHWEVIDKQNAVGAPTSKTFTIAYSHFCSQLQLRESTDGSPKQQNFLTTESVAVEESKDSNHINNSFHPGDNSSSKREIFQQKRHTIRNSILKKTKKKAAERNSSHELKLIASYFATQLYMIADLCLDRNYIAIKLVEKHYTFDILMTILKNPNSPNSFKAPVCKLIRCLYVDREPQLAAKFPRLIRTSLHMDEETLDSFSTFHAGSPYVFAILQEFISDYLYHELDTTTSNEYSSELMELLYALVTFGFYHTAEHLVDLLKPLTSALENHRNAVNLAKVSTSTKTLTPSYKIQPAELTDMTIRTEFSNIQSHQPQSPSVWRSVQTFFTAQSTFTAVSPSPTISNVQERSIGTRSPFSLRKSLSFQDSFRFFNAEEGGNNNNNRKSQISIEKTILQFLDSPLFICLSVILIIIATIVSMLSTFVFSWNSKSGQAFKLFDIFVSIVFIIELSVRFYCHWTVYKEIKRLLSNGFKLLDVFVVTMDIAMFIISIFALNNSQVNGITRYLKIIRVIRFLRIFRVGKLLNRMSNSADQDEWKRPVRYNITTPEEIRTVASMLKILTIVHDRIQDRQLTAYIKSFQKWCNDSLQSVTVDFKELYHDIVMKESISQSFPTHFNRTLIDIAMYSDLAMSEEALYLLMIHESKEKLLLETAGKIQIIHSSGLEVTYKSTKEQLQIIKQATESFELWGSLSDNNQVSTASQLNLALQTIVLQMRMMKEVKIVDFDTNSSCDVEIQQLLHNINAIETLLNLQHTIIDSSLESVSNPTLLQILLSSNEILVKFVEKNESNQASLFVHIDWFYKNIDLPIFSSKVIRAILSGNRNLIKQFPKAYIADVVQKIMILGRKPSYLDILIGLTDVADDTDQDSGIVLIRSEIVRLITNQERQGHIMYWCGSHYFEARRAKMKEISLMATQPEEKDLPVEVLYHINLLTLLAGCRLGQKLQGIYSMEEIVEVIIDSTTIFPVRRGLLLLLQEIIETNVEGLQSAEAVWKFFSYARAQMSIITAEFPTLFAKSKARIRSQYVEWLRLILEITSRFFSNCFDMCDIVDLGNSDNDAFELTKKSPQEIEQIVICLYEDFDRLLRSFRHSFGPLLQESITDAMYCMVQHLPDSHPGKTLELNGNGKVETQDALATEEMATSTKAARHKRRSSADSFHEGHYRKQFRIFCEAMQNEFLKTNAVSANNEKIFCKLPKLADQVSSDIRLEPFISKVCLDMRTRIQVTKEKKTLDPISTKIAFWLISTWTSIVENELGFNFKELLDLTSSADLRLRKLPFQKILNDCEVYLFCIELIAIGIETSLSTLSARLLVLLLLENGGNTDLQKKIYSHLKQYNDSTLFFEQLKDFIEHQSNWAQRQSTNDLTITLCDEVIVLDLIRVMSEGSYQPIKDLFREQISNARNINILDFLTGFMNILSKNENLLSIHLGIRVLNALMNLLKGPSIKNQEHIVLHTNLLTSLNRVMRLSHQTSIIDINWNTYSNIQKEIVIDVLRGLIEGQDHNSVILERVQLTMELNVLSMLILPEEQGNEYGDDEFDVADQLSNLQAKYLVFLQTIGNELIDIPTHAKNKIDKEVAAIEIIWNGATTKHVFHLPEFASYMSDTSKRKLLDEVELSSQELKLKDFMRKAKDLYREATHQKLLKTSLLGNLFLKLQHAISWGIFGVAVIANILLIAYFRDNSHIEYDYYPYHLPPVVRNSLLALSIIQLVQSIISVMIYLVVKLPVSFYANLDSGIDAFRSILFALANVHSFRYFGYFLISVLCIRRSYLFMSVFLLDFVMLDSTSKDVLFAVIYPVRQLFTTLVIILIAVNMFSGVLFSFYRDQFELNQGLEHYVATSMWQTIKIALAYGVRSDGGIGSNMMPSISYRFVVDILFYFLVNVVLLNIFFGIIIDTFGKLRNLKVFRETEEGTKCFICGIDLHDFMKTNESDSVSQNNAFARHRQVTHNMWNYLYFAIHIWQQSHSQDTSVEMFVRNALATGDVSWFPIGVSDVTSEGGGGHVLNDGSGGDEKEKGNASPSASRRRNSRHRSTLFRQSSLLTATATENHNVLHSLQVEMKKANEGIVSMDRKVSQMMMEIDNLKRSNADVISNSMTITSKESREKPIL